MAAGEAARLFVRVGADISGFSKGMAAAQAQMTAAANAMSANAFRSAKAIERSAKASLLAGAGFGAAPIQQVSLLNRALASSQARMQAFGSKMAAMAPGMVSTGRTMSKFVTLPIVAGFGYALKAAGDFEASLNSMQAVSGATGAQMRKVSSVAKKLGADITLPGTSAKDAAEAMTELAKGGLSVDQAMSAAKGTLQLSAAASIGNAEAATITADALNAFGLKGKDAGRVADLLAASANASTAEITDMAQSLQQSSAVAKMAGISIEDTVTALARLANAGIKGSDAGTSLKTMLLRLQAPIGSGAKALREFNIQLRDQHGNLKSLPALADEFGAKLGGLKKAQRDHAMAAIFGSDAIRAGNILLMQGSAAHEDMRDKVTKQGAAADLAAAKMKGFKGSLEAFKSSAETLAISLGQVLLPAATGAMRGMSGFASAIDGLPGPVKQVGMAILGVTAVIGPMAFGIGKLITTMAAAKAGTSALGIGLRALMSPWGLAAAGAAVLGFAIYKMLTQGKRVDVFAREMAGAFRETASASKAAADAIDRQKDAILRLKGLNLDARESTLRLRDAKARLAEIVREGGRGTDAYKRQLIEVERVELEAARSAVERGKTLRSGILDIKESTAAQDRGVASAAKARDMAVRQTFAIRSGIATGEEAKRITKNLDRAQGDLGTTLGRVVKEHQENAARARELRDGISGADSASQGFKRSYDKLAKLEALKASIAGAFWAVDSAAGAAAGSVQRLYDRLSKPPPAPKLPSLNPFGKGQAEMARADPISLILAQIRSKDPEIHRAGIAAAEKLSRALTSGITARAATLKATFGNIAASAMRAFQDQTERGANAIRARFGALMASITKDQGEMTPAEAEIARLEGLRDGERILQSVADAERDLAKAKAEGDPDAILAAERALSDARLEETLAGLRTQAAAERAAKDLAAEDSLAKLQTQMDDELRIYETGREIQQRQLETHLNAMEAKLARGKKIASSAAEAVIGVLGSYGIDFENSGKRLGKDFADGLKNSIGQVDSVADQIATKVAAKLRLRSPAKEGPLSDLNTWFTPFAPTLLSGLDMGAISAAVAVDGGSFQGARATAASGGNIYLTVNGWVGDDHALVERIRAELIRGGRRMPGVLGGLA